MTVIDTPGQHVSRNCETEDISCKSVAMTWRRMSFGLLLFFFLAGCAKLNPLATMPTRDPDRYFGPTWVVADQVVLSAKDLAIGFYFTKISGNRTTLLFCASGAQNVDLKAAIELIDDKDRSTAIQSVRYLDPLGNIQVGLIEFGARKFGASELFLQYRSKTGEITKTQFAKLAHTPEDGMIYQLLIEAGITTQLEFDGHIVSHGTGDFIPLKTPIPDGAELRGSVILAFRDIDSKDIYYYTVDFLSNDDVIGSISKR